MPIKEISYAITRLQFKASIHYVIVTVSVITHLIL